MNILQVVEACGAGVGRHVSGLCEDLASRGHRITVAYAPHRVDASFRSFLEGQQGKIRFVPLDVGRRVSPVSDSRGLLRLLRLIKREGPFDIVHGHSSKGGALGRIVGRLRAVPTVYTPNSLIMASPNLSRKALAFYTLAERVLGRLATSRFIAVAEDERDFAVGLKLVPEGRISVIGNAVAEQYFEDFSVISPEESLRERPLTFGSAIRFSEQKAPDNMVEAFIRMSRNLPEIPTRLVIAGDGELFEKVEKRAKESGLGDRISLPGWMPDAKDLLRQTDVFVISSLYEGLSFSTIEAMVARKPVISTEVFGTKETVCRVPGNVLVPVGDVAALAKGMERMATFSEPETLRHSLARVGFENHEYARQRFRQSHVTSQTIEVYRTLTKTNKGHARD